MPDEIPDVLFMNHGHFDVRFVFDSTSTPAEYKARLLAMLRDENPGCTIVDCEWVTLPNGFWRRLFRRPERGRFETTRVG